MSIKLTRFDLNLLLVLDALLAEVSVSRAADRLYVSQPAMSGSLNRLREIFGDQLLVRAGRQMQLTPLAKSLVEPVRDALLKIQTVLDTQDRFDPATMKRSFRVAMSDYCMVTLLPPLVEQLVTTAPNVRIIVEPFNKACLERMETGDIDYCAAPSEMSVTGILPRPEMIKRHPLYGDRFVCAVSNDHPIGDRMTMKDFMSYQHATVMDSDGTWSLDKYASYKAGIITDDFVAVPHFSALLFQIPKTKLIAVVPERIAKLYSKLIAIRTFEPPMECPAIAETLMWHIRNDLDQAHIWLRDLFGKIGLGLDNDRQHSTAGSE